MKFASMIGNSFGCSASGERLVSAARDGDFQEAKALLECNPRLARYSTFGVRNSPLHYSSAQGHHEIVSLLLESGVDMNLRNYRGQTALMQACHFGHWEVVQILMIFRANIHKTDYLNGGTALHFAALNGRSRCIRLLLVDYVPSVPEFWSIMKKRSKKETYHIEFDEGELSRVVNKPADGGITALHMAALNGHVECVQLLLDMGSSVSEVTIEDGTTIDLIGAGSTPLHYAACGGDLQCCKMLVYNGASLTAENANGWTPLLVARLWNRNWLEGILSKQPERRPTSLPSPYLSLPLMSIIRIAREYGWRDLCMVPNCADPCAVCLERRCTVSAEGCRHEFCTQCALYLCSTNSTVSLRNPGLIPCPLCRSGIISFSKLPGTSPIREMIPSRTSLSLTLCTTAYASEASEHSQDIPRSCRSSEYHCTRITQLPSSSSIRSAAPAYQRFGSMKMNTAFCMGGSDQTCSSLVSSSDRRAHNQMGRCLRSNLRRSTSSLDSRRVAGSLFSCTQYVSTAGSS